MAERFGSQTHPSGGQRFGSQTYAAVNAVAGDLHASESGSDTFAAASLPGSHGAMAATESGFDSASVSGISSLLFTLQAHESPTPDSMVSTGKVTNPAVRFGAQAHPSGGVRFGGQQWAALGPNGPLSATESGSDTAAMSGFVIAGAYTFQLFDIIASYVDYSSESIGAGITGTLDNGNKVMLPLAGPGGVSFSWETNELGNPSLRLAGTSSRQLSSIPWYVWNGSAWTSALFDVSDAMQGAAFLVETGQDVASFNGGQTRYGSLSAIESSGDDFVGIDGKLLVSVSAQLVELPSADSLSVSGSIAFTGNVFLDEGPLFDSFAGSGGVTVSGAASATETGSDSLIAIGNVSASGSLSLVESGSDSLASSGSIGHSGSVALAESATSDSFNSTALVIVSGSLVVSEIGQDAVSAAGVSSRTGSMAALEGPADSISSVGVVTVSGSFVAIDRPDSFSATGRREAQGDLIAAEFDAIEGRVDRFVGRGIDGDLPLVPDFDGPVSLVSTTTRYVVRSKKKAAAA